ncbi:MAG: Gfo/Idh/MocA family oxidoreductase, partial [Planctomycetes bacterium]|nr:Gfo/Idh/MocA family oxidoreductase [Planctomycetota bacterium]
MSSNPDSPHASASHPAPKGASPSASSDSPFACLRVVVVGARRVRQGTGPFLALQTAEWGADLVGVFGTRPVTAHHASAWLSARGVSVAEYSDWDSMMAYADPHAIVIASPVGTHRPWLELALAHDIHVLCEKPLLRGAAADSQDLAKRFAAAGLVLAENCQWPQTLEAFHGLHPQADLSSVSRFRMLLCPGGRGMARLLEVLSHPLSLLQAVFPGPAELLHVRYLETGLEASDMRLNFVYRVFDREIECEVVLEDTGTYPRPAEYAFDDFVCRRRVIEPGYRIGFAATHDENAKVYFPEVDPMKARLGDFFKQVKQAQNTHSSPIDEGLVR